MDIWPGTPASKVSLLPRLDPLQSTPCKTTKRRPRIQRHTVDRPAATSAHKVLFQKPWVKVVPSVNHGDFDSIFPFASVHLVWTQFLLLLLELKFENADPGACLGSTMLKIRRGWSRIHRSAGPRCFRLVSKHSAAAVGIKHIELSSRSPWSPNEKSPCLHNASQANSGKKSPQECSGDVDSRALHPLPKVDSIPIYCCKLGETLSQAVRLFRVSLSFV
jgi:hypothetical protein